MKNNFIFLVVSILLLSNYTNAQTYEKPSHWCGTELSKAQKDWLDEYQRNDALYRKKSIAKIYVPVKIHIVGKDDGSGYMSINDAVYNICLLNQKFSKDSVQLYFFLYKDIDYINNSSFYNDGSKTNNIAMQLINSSKIANVMNIYFVNASPGLCGYYNSSNDAIVIINSCAQFNNTTILHQVAHYFSIPHTFEGWKNVYIGPQCDTIVSTGMSKPSNPEKMDGSNCNIAGDGFCDTPPDYLPYRWTCPYNCSYRDPNNTLIHPDSSLYMSYVDDIYANRFSNEEAQAMHANCSSIHSIFTLNAAQNFNAVNSITTISQPIANGNYPCDYIPLSWSKVIGAEKYLVAIYKLGNSNNQVWSRITTDTFTSILASDSLKANLVYNVKVLAFNVGFPCNNWTPMTMFSTSKALLTNDLSNNSYIKIYPNPASNYFLVNYVSENSVGYNLSVIDLNGRVILNKSIHSTIGSEVVETSNWTSGEYFVQLRNADNKILKTEKVIVSK